MVYEELSRAGSDYNTGLNFPAGYTRVGWPFSPHECDWFVSRKILTGLYRWSFRLNQTKRKEYSVADMEYMAIIWKKLIDAVGERIVIKPGPPRNYHKVSHYKILRMLGKT